MKKNMNMKKNANVAFYSLTSATCPAILQIFRLTNWKKTSKVTIETNARLSNRVRKKNQKPSLR